MGVLVSGSLVTISKPLPSWSTAPRCITLDPISRPLLTATKTSYPPRSSLLAVLSNQCSMCQVICHSSRVTRGELLVNPTAMKEFSKIRELDDSATCAATLFKKDSRYDDSSRSLERSFTHIIDGSPVKSLRNKLMEADKATTIDEDGK